MNWYTWRNNQINYISHVKNRTQRHVKVALPLQLCIFFHAVHLIKCTKTQQPRRLSVELWGWQRRQRCTIECALPLMSRAHVVIEICKTEMKPNRLEFSESVCYSQTTDKQHTDINKVHWHTIAFAFARTLSVHTRTGTHK